MILYTVSYCPCIPPLLVLFLVRTVALWWLDAQRRLDAGERGNAKEDYRHEDEKGEEQTGDERGREQLIPS